VFAAAPVFSAPGEETRTRSVECRNALIGSPNQLEAVMANLGKRPPRFADP
jgi:hypothetical protein